MLRVQSNHDMRGFTEFEEEILFDDDDPDFARQPVPVLFRGESQLILRESRITTVAATNSMSLASVHPAELHSRHSSLATFSHSLDDLNSWDPQVQSHHALTIEELRLEMTSCFTCGVSWAHMHVSLDCAECGGYALERPCPVCDGACGAVWKRDLSTSHASSRARWQGTCNRESRQDTTSKQQTQELCSRLEKLSADS